MFDTAPHWALMFGQRVPLLNASECLHAKSCLPVRDNTSLIDPNTFGVSTALSEFCQIR